MSTTLTVGDLVVSTVYCTANNQTALNVRWWQVVAVGAGAAAATDSDVANALGAAGLGLAADYKPLMPPQATYRGVQAYIWRPAGTGPVPQSDITGQGPGTGAGSLQDTSVSGIISYKTSRKGRANRGRTYLPFPASGFLTTQGFPTALYLTTAAPLATFYSSPLNVVQSGHTATLIPVIAHRHKGPPVTYSTDQILSATVPALWGTQHRRGDYGRPNASPL